MLDLTRGYHNLLQKTENGDMQSFLWDGAVVGASDGTGDHYDSPDELGKPNALPLSD